MELYPHSGQRTGREGLDIGISNAILYHRNPEKISLSPMKYFEIVNSLYKHKFLIIFCVILSDLAFEWLVFRFQVLDDNPSVLMTLVKGGINISVLLLPFWWLKGRWRFMILIPWLILTMFFISNLGYFRVYGHLMPLKTFLYVKNFDLTLLGSLKTVFTAEDLWYVVSFLISAIAVIALALWRHNDKDSRPLYYETRKVRLFATAMTLTLFLLMEAYICLSEILNDECPNIGLSISDTLENRYLSANVCHNNITHSEDLLLYLAKAVVRECFQAQSIDKYSEAQLSKINQYFQRQGAMMRPVPQSFIGNESKNLLLIIVESLNSALIGMRTNDGLEICPTLNKLVQDSTVTYIPNVISQVADGRSSDGQLLYNVGLLPLRQGASAMLCEDNVYLSLADLIGKSTSFEIICERPSLWNHDITTHQFGFDALYSIWETTNANPAGCDHILFEETAMRLNKLREPFYCQITTLSMHQPFTDVGSYCNQSILDDESFHPFVCRYLNACNYFDHELGIFLKCLDEEFRKNSIIIIIGDHNIDFTPWQTGGDKVNMGIVSWPAVPMIILNSGYGGKIEKIIGQCDVFPTILDIMNLPCEPDTWRGMGISAFNPSVSGGIGTDGTDYCSSDPLWMQDAFTVSDLLLRGGGNILNREKLK